MQTPSPPPADSGSRRSTPPDNVISGEVQGHGPLQLEDLPEATHGPESPGASGSNVAPLLEGLVMRGEDASTPCPSFVRSEVHPPSARSSFRTQYSPIEESGGSGRGAVALSAGQVPPSELLGGRPCDSEPERSQRPSSASHVSCWKRCRPSLFRGTGEPRV